MLPLFFFTLYHYRAIFNIQSLKQFWSIFHISVNMGSLCSIMTCSAMETAQQWLQVETCHILDLLKAEQKQNGICSFRNIHSYKL